MDQLNAYEVRTACRTNVAKRSEEPPPNEPPLEGSMSHPAILGILLWLASGAQMNSCMEKIFYSYRNKEAPFLEKIKYWPFHKAIDYFLRA